MSKYEKQPTIVTNIGGCQWQNPLNCIITLLVSNPNVVATFLVAQYAKLPSTIESFGDFAFA
jgi:hypothetical protein